MPELRTYPFARFFDFVSADGVWTSWLFMALSFHVRAAPSPGGGETVQVDLTAAIQEFAMSVDPWPERNGGMDLQVDYLKREAIPAWVRDSTSASCSLKKKKNASEPQQTECFADDETPHARRRNLGDGEAATTADDRHRHHRHHHHEQQQHGPGENGRTKRVKKATNGATT